MKRKATRILTVIMLALSTNLAVADDFESTKIEARSGTSATAKLEKAKSAILAYLEDSEVWTSKEDWDAKRNIPPLGMKAPEDSTIFMCSYEGRKDILSIKENGSNQFTVSVLLEDKHSYETNEVEATVLEIEEIIRSHFDDVTKVTAGYTEDLLVYSDL